jgi:hypothetical protein
VPVGSSRATTTGAELRLPLDYVLEVEAGLLDEPVEQVRAEQEVEGQGVGAVVEIGKRLGALP